MLSSWFRVMAATPWRLAISASLVFTFLLTSVPIAAIEPGTAPFQRTWKRTDQPVLDGLVARTWMWGPQANSELIQEPYSEAPGGGRTVQYFDKARMEDNSYRADGPPWDVTNGLLVVEMVTGRVQLGDVDFESRAPAAVNVAGDADDLTGPTYATFDTLLNAAPRAIGSAVTDRVDRDGKVNADPALGGQGVTVGHLDEVTNHAIAAPFWDFMNSSGTVYENGQFVSNALFENPYFATGRPITEAYWASVKVAGTYRDVLMQCFERRCLTYTPGNPAGFVVEAGNVGQHYYAWRYDGEAPPATPTPQPSVTPTGTAEFSETPEPTAVPSATPSATPEATPSATPEPEPATQYDFLTSWGEVRQNIRLNEPNMVATAPNGDIYVTNTAENQILRFAPDGELMTYWGSQGTNTGQFNTPVGIGVDGEGNVYVADNGNHRVQKFDPNGAFITTWGSEGVDPGQFKYPYGLAVGPDGTVYVSEQGNNRIQSFNDFGGFLKTWGGLGTGPGQFVTPHGIAVSGSVVYVADAGNQRIQVFNVDGEFQGMLGEGGEGPGQFSLPLGVVVSDDGSVFVSDIGLDRVQIFTPLPVVTPAEARGLASVFYKYAGMVDEAGAFNNPLGLGFDGAGRLMVVDAANGALKFYASDAIALHPTDFTLTDTWLDDSRGRFRNLTALAQGKDGRIYVIDNGDDEIGLMLQVFSPDGDYLDQWRGQILSGLAFDSRGNLFTYNFANSRIEKFSPDGEFLEGWGPAIPSNGESYSLVSLAVDAEDNLYVANAHLNSIEKYSPNGTYLDAWGAPGSQPGQFKYPSGIAIYGEHIYVGDSGNLRIQEFDLSGTFVRMWGSVGSGNGQFLDGNIRIAVDDSGYVYAADSGNNRIQKFAPDGEFLAKWGSEGNAPGSFNGPGDLVVDPSGDVYVIDFSNFRIQVFRPLN